MPRLPRSFFRRDARLVARELLGHILATTIDGVRTSGRIVETEAYLGKDDQASHAWRGITKRNAAMFEDGGHAYVYLSYGMYYCFNVAASVPGTGQGVLIRAVEPLQGLDVMRARRGRHPKNDAELSNGPGKLVIALGISPAHNGADLIHEPTLKIVRGNPLDDREVAATPRIGISRAVNEPWRYVKIRGGG